MMTSKTCKTQNDFWYFGKWEIQKNHVFVLLIWFFAAILCKGPALTGGYAVDDYAVSSGINLAALVNGQGRFLLTTLLYVLQQSAIDIVDLGAIAVICVILLHVSMVGSILRFLSFDLDYKYALGPGLIMICHPYTAEIYTSRMGMLGFGIALFSIITSLDLIRKYRNLKASFAAITSITLGLLTYQIVFNYIATVLLLSTALSCFVHAYDKGIERQQEHVSRTRNLFYVLVSAVSLYLFLTYVVGLILKIVPDERATLIKYADIPMRVEQICLSLKNIFWNAEPIMQGWLKTVQLLLLVISCCALLIRGNWTRKVSYRFSRLSVLFFLICCCLPLSLGVIVFFNAWWPVPRVVAHVAVIVGGLVFFPLYAAQIGERTVGNIRYPLTMLLICLIVGFICVHTKVFADQHRINHWDRALGNRFVARLEILPNFRKIKAVHIVGGFWRYPSGPKTIQGDLNISSLGLFGLSTQVLNAVTGYDWRGASEKEQQQAESLCKKVKPWPDPDSVFINNELGVICFRNDE